ncbi:FixH family protein [Halioxenophilus sp. WMMB6]|uniref:FixH family protein n=1 Tax=Halioxenophilus sp. WMMB6 TaxID=3073815 RepID=UPI00295E71A6|nr:FixH family protein [Halioxenophilus sp. WMMB6]
MTSEPGSKPWYREFWAWFILAPLIASIILSGMMVFTAVRFGDDEVTVDYYKKGRLINQSMEQVELAASLGLSADITFDLELGEVLLRLQESANTPLPEELTLYLDHPVSEELDRILTLKEVAPGYYRADLDSRPDFRWYLRLVPGDAPITTAEEATAPEHWRLNGEIDFRTSQQVQLQAP